MCCRHIHQENNEGQKLKNLSSPVVISADVSSK